MNFDFITDNMAVGTTPETQDDVKALADAGVMFIINCRDDHDDKDLLLRTDVGFKWQVGYLWNGTPDWTPKAALGLEPKPVEWFQRSLEFCEPWRPSHRLYVHCSAGVNRSATTAWMFLRAMQIKGEDCDLIIDRHRPIAAFGTFADHPWRQDAERALVQLGYLRG